MTGLAGWWDFSDAATLYEDTLLTDPVDVDGDYIRGVADKSGNNQSIGAGPSAVTYVADGFNGLSVARLANVGIERTANTIPATWPITVLFVAGAGTLNRTFMLSLGPNWTVRCEASGAFGAFGKTSASKTWAATPKLFAATVNATTTDLYLGGGTAETFASSAAPSTPSTNWIVGRQGGSYWTGDICEILVYDSMLSETALDHSGAYLAAKWGLTWSPVVSGTTPDSGIYLHFDDALEGVYTLAYPYLDALGMAATVYVNSAYIGTAGYMTSAQLQTLDAAGWDIANHGATHLKLSGQSEAAQTTELNDCRTALNGWGLTGASSHVAYANGSYDATTLTVMAAESYLTGRTINASSVTVPVAAPYELPCRLFYQDTSLDGMKTLLTADMNTNKHVNVLMHNIVESGGESYDQLYDNFTALVDWIDASNYPVKVITELTLA